MKKVFTIYIVLYSFIILYANLKSKIEFKYSYTKIKLPFTGIVNGNNVNIRSKPTLKSYIIKKANIGEEYYAVKTINGFYKIILPPLRGWVASRFVENTYISNNIGLNIGTINAKNVNIRKNPSLKSKSLGKLQNGQEVIIYGEKDEFYEVELKETRYGYIFQEYLTPKSNIFYEVIVDKLNLRNGPGIRYKKIGALKLHENVMVLKFSNDFARILLKNGKNGWVAFRYLKKIKTTNINSNVRSNIISDFNEQNYFRVIKNGVEYLKNSALFDKEIASLVSKSYFNIQDYANALKYYNTVKKNDEKYAEKHLNKLYETIKQKLGDFTIQPFPEIELMCNGDMDLDGIEEYIALLKNNHRYFIQFFHFENNKFIPSSKKIALPFLDEKIISIKTTDLDKDAIPEIIVYSENKYKILKFDNNRFYPLENYSNFSDLVAENKFSHKIYAISGNKIIKFNYQEPENKKGEIIPKTSARYIQSLNTISEVPAFLIYNQSNIYLIEWDIEFKYNPITIPKNTSLVKISWILTTDLDLDGISEIIVNYAGDEINPTVIKIYRLTNNELSEIYSLSISCSLAFCNDINKDGKEELIVISPQNAVYIIKNIW